MPARPTVSRTRDSLTGFRRPLRIAAAFMVAAVTAPGMAYAQFTTPHLETSVLPRTTTLGTLRVTHHGLVGAGRIDAASRDARNETLGSVSDMAIDPATWARGPDGSYAATFYTLPDRGYNDPATQSFSDFVGRVQRFDMTFAPYTSAANLPQAKASQNQISLSYRGLQTLSDERGRFTTGADPGTGTRTAFGTLVPEAANGRMSLDAEGLVLRPDGSRYVSDEYASAIYHFVPDRASPENLVLGGVISPPDALVPRTGGAVNFNSINAPNTGRRNNQGMEGLSVTPDGRFLLAVNQSAALQDVASGSGQSSRKYTRVLVYDIENDPTPTTPIGHYVLELPTFTFAGDGGAVNRTAAQSAIFALSESQFLVLPRDGNGFGSPTTNPHVYKSVLLADTAGATNLVGSAFEGTTPVSTAAAGLDPRVTPVLTAEVLNMLDPTDLARLGMNLDTSGPGTETSLTEKQEGLSLMPALDSANPNDYFLFVANDNDFKTRDGNMLDADGNDVPYDAGQDVDSMVLAYRVTIEVIPEPTGLTLALAPAAAMLRRRRQSLVN